MDFKVAGTGQGITAIQMDMKGGGLPIDMLGQVFAQSRRPASRSSISCGRR